MKYSVVVAALVASVAAQANLPACALLCATQNAGVSGCSSVTDTACLCRSQAYLAAFASCLGTSCSAADQQSAATAGNALCQAAGVTITNTPSATGSATGSVTNSAGSSSAASVASSVLSSASASASSAGNSSAIASISSASRSLSSAVSSASANATASMSSASSRASSASAAASSAASSASSSAASATSSGAAATHGLTWEFLGAAAAGVAALL